MTASARHRGALALLAAAGVALAGCAPTLDWRDVRPQASALHLQFPCKPMAQQRDLVLAGVHVKLALHACTAGNQTWGLALADVGDPAGVDAALAELSAAAAAKLGAAAGQTRPLRVFGATPHATSTHQRLHGRLPDGKPVQMQLAVFAHGTSVFQATVLGTHVAEDSAETFFGSLRFGP